MNELKKDLEAVIKAMKTLTEKAENLLEKIEKIEEKTENDKVMLVVKTAQTGEKAQRGRRPASSNRITAKDNVFSIIKRSRKGVDTSHLRVKTGFNDKKIQNIIYKLKKQGLIRNIRTGIYVKS